MSVTAPVPEYWSMQFCQMNTDNFAASDQRDQRFGVGAVVEATIIGRMKRLMTTRRGDQSPTLRASCCSEPPESGMTRSRGPLGKQQLHRDCERRNSALPLALTLQPRCVSGRCPRWCGSDRRCRRWRARSPGRPSSRARLSKVAGARPRRRPARPGWSANPTIDRPRGLLGLLPFRIQCRPGRPQAVDDVLQRVEGDEQREQCRQDRPVTCKEPGDTEDHGIEPDRNADESCHGRLLVAGAGG